MAKKKATRKSAKPRPARKRSTMVGADFLSLTQRSPADVVSLFQTAAKVKRNIRPYRRALEGTTTVLLFEKSSLRTRITFETGINALGGTALYMDHANQRLGERESVRDYGKNLERWVDCVVARLYRQSVIEELADNASIPIINALSDRFHPCQALADLFSLWERTSGLDGLRLAYIGDGNNVCHSLMHAASMLGVDMTVITPVGYSPAPDVVEESLALAAESGAVLAFSHDPAVIESHHAVYTDVWVSMGQADEAGKRRSAFADYAVTPSLMQTASRGIKGGSLFMHCLPALRGVEVMDEVIDAPTSIVYDQAENRMHVQNALLLHMFGKA